MDGTSTSANRKSGGLGTSSRDYILMPFVAENNWTDYKEKSRSAT